MNESINTTEKTPSQRIDERLEELSDWRKETLQMIRNLIHRAVPNIEEEWKWRGVPVWSSNGIVCTGEVYKDIVKVTFAKGASLNDPKKLFNAGLTGNTRRAIDVHENDPFDEEAFMDLIREAVGLNHRLDK